MKTGVDAIAKIRNAKKITVIVSAQDLLVWKVSANVKDAEIRRKVRYTAKTTKDWLKMIDNQQKDATAEKVDA